MRLKNLTRHRKEQGKQLKRLERLLKPLKQIAIAGMLLLPMMCGGCSAPSAKIKIKEPCMASVVTYGDAVECMIKLNEINNF